MYSAVVLNDQSQKKLADWANKNVKVNGIRLPILVRDAGWTMYCHHMTIKFPGIPEFIRKYVDTEVSLEVTHVGIDDMVIAVRVVGFHSDNRYPHVTVAVNTLTGGKPVMSNDISEWTPIESKLLLKGTVKLI